MLDEEEGEEGRKGGQEEREARERGSSSSPVAFLLLRVTYSLPNQRHKIVAKRGAVRSIFSFCRSSGSKEEICELSAG